MKSYSDIITDIINREGPKYTNIAGDKGGPTKYGITLATLQAYTHIPMTADNVRDMTESTARAIYMQMYILEPGYNKLNNPMLVEQLIDSSVQHGQTTTIQMLQRCLGLPADGVIGPATIAAVMHLDPVAITAKFLSANAHYYAACCRIKTNLQFAGGWFNRLGDLLTKLALAQAN